MFGDKKIQVGRYRLTELELQLSNELARLEFLKPPRLRSNSGQVLGKARNIAKKLQ